MKHTEVATGSVVIVVTDGVTVETVVYPADRLREAGHAVALASPDGQPVETETGGTVPVDQPLATAVSSPPDLLLLPDGLEQPPPERLVGSAGIVAAIGTGIETLAATDRLGGHHVACQPSVGSAVEAAGGTVDTDPVVVDDTVVTARDWSHRHAWLRAVRETLGTPTATTTTHEPIGVIHSPFDHQVGTPIQPVYTDGSGVVSLEDRYAAGLRDVESFSHLFLLYTFHEADAYELQPKPFKTDERRGLFATRAPRRPNPIGLSVVRLESIEGSDLVVSGIDVVDGTPLLDIKPYVPPYDDVPDAAGGWLTALPEETRERADDRFLER